MRAFVDTNVLIRHLTADPAEMGERATHYLGHSQDILLTDLMVGEVVYVLESFCDVPRAQVAEAVRSLLAMGSVVCVDPALLRRAVEIFEIHCLDFAEAYLVACAESTGVNQLVSFDRSIDGVGTVERIEPGRP